MKNLTTTTWGSGRSAFTLVELLLVVSIIAVLASLGVGILAQAQNDAAQSATRSRISLIEKILETELENYEVRRSPVSFNNLLAIVNNSSLDDTSSQRSLHVKNLKRMAITDLIRAEMPDGSAIDLGAYPSTILAAYLNEIGITNPNADLDSDGDAEFPPATFQVTRWGDASIDVPADGIAGFADRSELLYRILLDIDLDGVPAVEQVGAQSIGDTDGDGNLEVVDAWGDPIILQWQQENILLDMDDINMNVWETPTEETKAFVGLSKESSAAGVGFADLYQYAKPVLPTQVRPFLTSERLVEIDGVPADYDVDHQF